MTAMAPALANSRPVARPAPRRAGRAWVLRRLARLFRPLARLSVSEWADAYRQLSNKASAEAGAWRTFRTPFLREILDSLSDECPVERVIVQKSAQIGVTEVGLNWLGYIMDHVRTSKPTLVVLPTLQLRVEWVRQRLDPMLDAVPRLRLLIDVGRARDASNREDLKSYPGGILMIATAGSAASLKSKSIRFVLCDEADEFDWDVQGRGDPMGLIESRAANFPRRKFLIISTPTVKGASRIEGEYDASDRRQYHVPCPHCGEYQVLTWERMQWDKDANAVWYACQHNGCVIDERHKPDMLAAGRWVPRNPERKTRGYQINALYSPIGLGYSWPELVGQWLAAQDDVVKLQHFLNERLGVTWEDRRSNIGAHALGHRAEDYRLRSVPPGCLLLTAGVDTQDDRLAVQILGFGAGRRFWVIDWIELPGDPGRPAVWSALAERLNAPLVNAYGQSMRIKCTAVDMGGHRTEEVKSFVRGAMGPRLNHKCIAVVGDNLKQHAILPSRPRKTDYTSSGRTKKSGFDYWRVGTERAKDWLYNALRGDEDKSPEERLAHFSADLETDYYDQLTAETWDARKNRYVIKRGRRNESLDTWVYALAAAHHPLVDLQRKRKADWAAMAARLEPMETTPAAPEPPPAPAKSDAAPKSAERSWLGRNQPSQQRKPWIRSKRR